MKNKTILIQILLAGLLISLTSNISLAQDGFRVSGTVSSIVNNEPIKDINVKVEGMVGLFEITDEEGKFSIEVPSPEITMLFTYPGYKDLSVYLDGQSEINIKLTPEEFPSVLDEVILASGSKQKRFIAQSYEQLQDKDFRERPYSTAENFLTGHIAGVNVTSYNGMPGA